MFADSSVSVCMLRNSAVRVRVVCVRTCGMWCVCVVAPLRVFVMRACLCVFCVRLCVCGASVSPVLHVRVRVFDLCLR